MDSLEIHLIHMSVVDAGYRLRSWLELSARHLHVAWASLLHGTSVLRARLAQEELESVRYNTF